MKILNVQNQQIGVPNLNNHVFPLSEIVNIVDEFNKGKKVFGMLGMPQQNTDSDWNTPLTETTASHKITNLRIENEYLVGDVEILSTQSGKMLEDIVFTVTPDFRFAGTGNVKEEEGNHVITDFVLHSINAVTDGA